MLTELHQIKGTGDFTSMPNGNFSELVLMDTMPQYIDLSGSSLDVQQTNSLCYEHNDMMWLGSGPSDTYEEQPCGQESCIVCPY